jgi:hypothetical protein
MTVVWTILPILLLLYAAASIVLDQIAWRDFRKRKFSSFEEKQKFRKILFWSPWGSYRYLRLMKKKPPLLAYYIRILASIGLLSLVWLFDGDGLIAAKAVLTALALFGLSDGYLSIRNLYKKPTTKS